MKRNLKRLLEIVNSNGSVKTVIQLELGSGLTVIGLDRAGHPRCGAVSRDDLITMVSAVDLPGLWREAREVLR